MPASVVVAAARTPIGRAFKGSLTSLRADDLAAIPVRAVAATEGVDPRKIDDVICGAALQAGEQSMNLGRVVGVLAGLPSSVPGTTVNRFCASSLQAIRMADHAIRAGEGDVFIAAGVESVTRINGKGFDEEDKNPRFTDAGRLDYVNDLYIPMGLTAENVARQWRVDRREMDELALRSHRLAVDARESGVFAGEIVPVELPNGDVVREDDGPRADTGLDVLAGLKPAFVEDGTVTAGNSCPLSDGAAAVLVMSEARARELGLTPKVRILASAVSGVEPEVMGVGPIEAIRRVLALAGMSIRDVDVVELNEAFASQVLAVCRELEIDVETQLNPHGGAIALGHPFGMTGARIMTTLINDLETLDGEIGLEAMCVGGGQGMAMLVQRMR